ncbi:MAG: hypothetical protein ACRD96_19225 [Bryobacteraceae bacterium]
MRFFFVFSTCASLAAGACVGFVAPRPASRCEAASSDLEWLNRPASLDAREQPNQYYDSILNDSALFGGVAVSGDLQFELRAPGPHLLEVFLLAGDEEKRSFSLHGGGGPLDGLRPQPGVRQVGMVGIAEGRFTVRSDAPRYLLSAVRWTAVADFEKRVVPRYLVRLRELTANPVFGPRGAVARRNRIEQVAARLVLSESAEVRREATIAMTRAAYWIAAENQEPEDIARLASWLERSLQIAPGDSIVRKMVSSSCLGINADGRPLARGPLCDGAKGEPWGIDQPDIAAPAWALEQRRLVARMDAITRWWVDHRQQPNGELGGGWGDDVEMLREWSPLALGLGSSIAAKGVKQFADGLWNSDTPAFGSEPITGAVPLLAALFPQSAQARSRLASTAACADNWIVPQPDGHWRFRGAWFNCRDFDRRPEWAVDVHLNTRAIGPAMWHAYLTRDPALIERLSRWAESWTQAMRSTEHGKPAGIFPPVIRSADGSFLWDQPNAEGDSVPWSGGSQEALASLLIAVHDLTGDAKWLDAAGESFQALDRCGEHAALCGEIVRHPEAFHEWRRRTGNPRYDQAFGYTAKRDTRATLARLATLAREAEAALGVNYEMYTSEALFTDRVYYRLPAEYAQRLFGGEAPRGDRYPSFAVTWPAIDPVFARAVLDAGPDSLTIQAYNFEGIQIEAPLRAWRLLPGRYLWTARNDRGFVYSQGDVQVSRLPQIIRLALPPRREVTVRIQRAGAPPPKPAPRRRSATPYTSRR